MGKKTTKTTSTSTPWQPAQPLLLGAGQGITDMVNKAQPGSDALAAGLNNHVLPGIQQQIGDTKQQLQPGLNYANNVLGGQYLNSNPYTQAMTQQAGQDAGNAVNSTFSAAGRTGSGNHATDLARGVAQAENGVMFQNYQNERSNQNTAAGMLPAMTSAQYAGYQPLLQGTQLAGQLPYYGASALGNIGGLYGGYGTQSGTQPGGWGTNLLNAAAGGAAMAFSDRRLKIKIKKLGEFADGLGIYEFAYKRAPDQMFKGVMADEVEKLRPQAYVPNYRGSGFAGVDYGAL